MLLPRMIDDAFKLTLDYQFPAPLDSTPKQGFPVDGYDDQMNMWQPVYQMKP